ncbi:MAG TPA: carboxypeptidase regulatory-like domain-containing protein [Bryobacteraceae bacterium]|nr:carboxypeptidase regulatory-like domain-containing protein [Bryobacteraceae bacterium]
MLHAFRLLLVGIIAFVFMCVPVAAQEAGAQIQGVITDASGAGMPDVAVTVTNQDTGVARTTKSDSSGHYLVAPLPPGTYIVTADKTGWAKYELKGLLLQIGTDIERNIAMSLASVQSTVTVEAQTPAVDTTHADVSGVVTEQQITTLPVNTRQYLNLALLQPGTSQDASRTFYNNVQIGGGGYFYANGFMIDGVRNTWAEQGEPRQNFPEGAVQEFKVYVDEYPAEFGLYMGGLVSVATKSGTNAFHGELFEYWRNEALNHDNEFQQAAETQEHTGNPFNRNQFGADIGGPIVKDRTHFYLAYERTQTNASYTIFTAQPLLYSATQGTFTQPGYDQMITARVDHQISNNHSVFVRYGQEWNRLTYQGCGGNSERNCYDGLIPRKSIVAGDTWTPSPSLVNEFHFQWAISSYLLGPPGSVWRDASTLATSPAATANLQLGYVFPSFSYGYGYQEDGVERRWEGNDVLSLQKGDHTFRFGFDINYVPFIDSTASNVQGTYTFGTDQPFNPYNPASVAALTNPILFTASIPPVATSVPTWELGFFASDEWRVRSGLTVNLGLRYDRELGSFNEGINLNSYPEVIPFMGDPSKRGDDNNFGPRVGISWDPFHKGKDVFHGGYGIYYNNIQTLLNFNENRDLATCTITIRNPIYLNPFNGQSESSFCSTAPPTVTVLAPNYVNPYSQQSIIGYSHQFTSNTVMKVNGVYQHTLRDYRVVDLNYPNASGVRPLPAWGQINQHQSTAQAKYKALYVEFDKRFSNRFQATVSYTLASSTDNNPQSAITDYSDPNLNWGPSNIDRRNSLVAAGSVNLPWKITFGAMWTIRSSLPFSAYESVTNFDGTLQFVPGTSRNQGNRGLSLSAVNAYRATLGLAAVAPGAINTNPFNSFDVHLSRSFFVTEHRRLEVIGQCFNLFGHENLAAGYYITSAASPSFGTITSAGNLQQAELAARFVF